MTVQLTLQPEPQAAGLARRWVRQQFVQMSRPDLIETAVLGVSELVTNAVLHVRGTILVRVVETGGRLQVEVYDDSPRSPEGSTMLASRQSNPPTVGRGLQIVDSISLAWGVAYEAEGKCVWFQPAVDGGREKVERAIDQTPAASAVPREVGEDLLTVTMVDLPINLLAYYRTRFRDLRREMTLIALDPDAATTVAQRLADVALRLDAYRRFGADNDVLIDEAAANGQDRITLTFNLPRAALPGVSTLKDLLEEADQYCRDRELLTLAAGPQERHMRSWYLGEVLRQADGEPPIPWPGAFVVTDPAPLKPAGPH